jgi:hypothetical protein
MRFVGGAYQYPTDAVYLAMDKKLDRVIEIYRWKRRGKWVLEFYGDATPCEMAVFTTRAARDLFLKAFRCCSEMGLVVYDFSDLPNILRKARP